MSPRLPRDEHEIVLQQDSSWDPIVPKKDSLGMMMFFLNTLRPDMIYLWEKMAFKLIRARPIWAYLKFFAIPLDISADITDLDYIQC